MSSREALLTISDLRVHFQASGTTVRAVDGVDLQLFSGETLALVGESGCGKSTLARALVGLNPITSGEARLRGERITSLSRADMRRHRRELQLVFQDPYASLNPRFTIAETLAEPLLLHEKATRGNVDAKVCELLGQVGLDAELRHRYPHEFSGGQRQRISIARALAVEPTLLLCDEVTSALDVSIQAQILDLLRSVQQKLGLSYLFITHDLGVVRYIAHRVAVMYVGQIVELRDTESLFESPAHPYTQALLGSIPRVGGTAADKKPLAGEVPSPARPPSGCRFHPRCPQVFERCPREMPELYAVGVPVEVGVPAAQEPVPFGKSRCFLNQ
ncbi:MAG TPA: ABC transporter ATP-binding protein [Polyangiaceae bacterium]|nr:ABC transporter ATP-binding protein [Polyangiaceae bacterium]